MRSINVIPAVSIVGLSVFTAFGQAAPAPTGGAFNPNMLFMMAIMFAIVYFLMIRPEQKKQKARLELLKNIKKGDKVLTSAGIIGVVGNIKDNTVMVKIGENNVVEFTKSAITAVINDEKAVEKEEKK
jgi:preprotein translocase subunit YajC